MAKVRINIKDKQFGYPEQISSSHGAVNKYVEWVYDNELVSNSCFFTDTCFTDVYKLKPGVVKRKIAWLNEPRAIAKVIAVPDAYEWIAANNRLFDFVLTFDKQLLSRGENFLYYPAGRLRINNSRLPAGQAPGYNNDKKTKLCSMFASPQRTTVGHKLRHEIISKFGDEMDVFGKEYHFVDFKETGLCEYYFSIAIENSIQDDYWTEKLCDCFATKAIPIYWGSKSVLDHFNKDGIIMFDKIDNLQDILSSLTPKLYESMLPAIEDNFERVEKYRIPEDWIYKQYPFLFD